MLRLFKIFFVLIFGLSSFAFASNLDFTLLEKGDQKDNNKLLIIGGIQGDEPGGFTAASIIGTHYKLKSGSAWIVPNLNFPSIIKRSRGLNGDMNRKFSDIKKSDPDYDSVKRIKSLILSEKVGLVLNLHDGSGFYRKRHKNWKFSPYRWGQSCIIDQENMENKKYGNLNEIASKVAGSINRYLQNDVHKYHVKNTRTKEGNAEMLKTLTYFAVSNKKPAFANEASKSLPLHLRVYYHLLAIEEYMDIMGIKYERTFAMNPLDIKDIIDNDIYEILWR